jgi:hypothetical protein
MKFTFGIITSGDFDQGIDASIDTIENLDIPEYEIVIVGNSQVDRKNTKIIEFDETQKKAWITKKKNLITENAKYENIVYTHDYIIFESDWYQGYLKYGDDFNVCMNRVLNIDRSRWHDWLLWPHNNNFMDEILFPNRHCLIPYDMSHLSKYMYISGAYWVAKKNIMEEFPLNENLCWGEGEDTEWSFRVREKYNFSMNKYSTVRTLKPKKQSFSYANSHTINILNNVC